MQPAPNWEDFIQNSLISCFINLEPQAEMFKAAGRPGPVVKGKRANEWEEKRQRNYVCTLASLHQGAPTITIIKVIWKVTKLLEEGNHLALWLASLYLQWTLLGRYKGGSKGAAILLLRSGGIFKTSLLYTQLTATLAILTHAIW